MAMFYNASQCNSLPAELRSQDMAVDFIWTFKETSKTVDITVDLAILMNSEVVLCKCR